MRLGGPDDPSDWNVKERRHQDAATLLLLGWHVGIDDILRHTAVSLILFCLFHRCSCNCNECLGFVSDVIMSKRVADTYLTDRNFDDEEPAEEVCIEIVYSNSRAAYWWILEAGTGLRLGNPAGSPHVPMDLHLCNMGTRWGCGCKVVENPWVRGRSYAGAHGVYSPMCFLSCQLITVKQ